MGAIVNVRICSFSSMNHSHKRRFRVHHDLTNRAASPTRSRMENQLTLAFMGMVLRLIIHVTKFALLVTGANTFPSLASIDVSLSLIFSLVRASTNAKARARARVWRDEIWCKASDVVYFCGFRRYATYNNHCHCRNNFQTFDHPPSTIVSSPPHASLIT